MKGVKINVNEAGAHLGVHITVDEPTGKTHSADLTKAMRKSLGITSGPIVVFDIDERGTLVGIEVV
jgi:hypothetical protein